MALTPASVLADYSSGIGTQGATLQIKTNEQRIGIGTTNPQGTLQVGTGITMGSGIITATAADFSGNLTVGGVLTYEDVTNVDSVGVITARAGLISGNLQFGVTGGAEIDTSSGNLTLDSAGGTTTVDDYLTVTGGGNVSAGDWTFTGASSKNVTWDNSEGALEWADNAKAVFGAGNDLQIYHTGSHSLIDETGTGNLTIRSSLISFEKYQNEQLARFTADGGCEFYHDNTKKLETTSTGVVVTGILTATTVEQTQTYPTIRPTLDLNFAATKTLDRRITFTRDGIGTYYDELGVLKYASSNVPRFDHNPTTGESLGLLIEESRTNFVTNSNAPSGQNYSWSTNTTNDNVLTPDERLSTVRRLTSSGSGSYTFRIGSTTAGSADTTYTGSVWIRTVSGTVQINVDMNDQGTHAVALSTDWVRFEATGTTPSSGASAAYRFLDIFATTTADLYVWGAQIEEGAFATSYIPTGSSTVTRGDDDAVIKGTNFSDFYNETEGTIFSEFSTKVNTGTTTKWIVSLRDPANNDNYIAQSTYSSTTVALSVQSGGSTVAYISNANSVVVDQFRRIAASFKVNDFDGADGGTLLTGDTSGAMPTGISQMDIGRGWTNSNQKLEGHIKSIKYYRTKLPDAQLQGLTA